MRIEVPVPNSIIEGDKQLSRFIDMCLKYKEHIDCLYLPLGWVAEEINVWGIRAPQFVYTEGQFDTNRVSAWEHAVLDVVSYTGLPVRILMNDTFNPAFSDQRSMALIAKKLAYYQKKFHELGSRVLSVMVADCTLIPHLRLWGFRASLSTNSHNTFPELDMILSMYGTDFESITLSRNLNRPVPKLKKYLTDRPAIRDKIVLMANEGCVSACPYKESGDLEISTTDIKTQFNRIHAEGCGALERGSPWMFFTSPYITRPIYDQHIVPALGTVPLKLAGRNLFPAQIEKMVAHLVEDVPTELSKYLNVSLRTAATTHDLSPEHIRRVTTCNKECFVCRDCELEFLRLTDKHPKYKVIQFVPNSEVDRRVLGAQDDRGAVQKV